MSHPNCHCGAMSFIRPVMKDGPNKGREFYTCGVTPKQCDFFKWADQAPKAPVPKFQPASSLRQSTTEFKPPQAPDMEVIMGKTVSKLMVAVENLTALIAKMEEREDARPRKKPRMPPHHDEVEVIDDEEEAQGN